MRGRGEATAAHPLGPDGRGGGCVIRLRERMIIFDNGPYQRDNGRFLGRKRVAH
jgi:hypothetical protein